MANSHDRFAGEAGEESLLRIHVALSVRTSHCASRPPRLQRRPHPARIERKVDDGHFRASGEVRKHLYVPASAAVVRKTTMRDHPKRLGASKLRSCCVEPNQSGRRSAGSSEKDHTVAIRDSDRAHRLAAVDSTILPAGQVTKCPVQIDPLDRAGRVV